MDLAQVLSEEQIDVVINEISGSLTNGMAGFCTEKCFKSCVEYPKDYLTAKQRSCVDTCASNFQADYAKIVASFQKKNRKFWK